MTPVLAACTFLEALPGPAGDAVKAARGCPDVSTLDAAASLDFAREFDLDAAVAGKIKAGVMASTELTGFAMALDADLNTACSGLAKDLGSSATFKTGVDACNAAVDAMADTKAKMGAGATIDVAVEAPTCSMSLDAMGDCLAKCDANVEAGKADVKCEGELSGACDGTCTGTCDLEAGASCSGSCEGSCDAQFSGTCGGTCNGTCVMDGTATAEASAGAGGTFSGQCNGKCEGSCDAEASGTCGGKCQGSCELQSGGKCEGTCTGGCTVEFKEPSCSGNIVPPAASAECQSTCDAHASAHMTCSEPEVSVVIQGAADAEAAARYQAALEKNLPLIVKVAVGMAPKLHGLASSATTTLEGGIAAVQAAIGTRPTAGARMTACLLEPFQGAIVAAANVKASVDISVDVQAKASASGGAVAQTGPASKG
jgi:hypothetical protein